MLIAWMIYAAAVTTIVAGCAIALDRVAEIWNLSRRAIWLAALAVSVAVPAERALRPTRAAQTSLGLDSPTDVEQRVVTSAETMSPVRELDARERFLNALRQVPNIPSSWNSAAAVGWLVASSVLAMLLLRGALVLSFKRARWTRSVVDGHPVLVTTDVGPAVVGVIRPRILFPSWALRLDHCERAMMLEHEAEHLRARDPMLTVLAAWTLALFPWSPAMWLIVKRLRLAIEIDCDRRVLSRRRDDVRDYGMLLLTVGSRSANVLQYTVSLAEPRRFLEQRIVAMTASRPSRPLVASTPFVAIALIAAIAAAQTPAPAPIPVARPATPVRVEPSRDTVATPRPPHEPEVAAEIGRRTERIAEGLSARWTAPTVATQQRPEQPIPIDVIRAWISVYQPNVIAGDPTVNAVTIIVDDDNQYLRSVADSIEGIEPTNPANILVRGRLQGLHPVNAMIPRPMIVVDGVRVDSTTQLDTIPIEQVEVIKGRSAAAQYGPDAAAGAVIIKSMRPDASMLARLGVSPDSIKEMTELRLRPGVIGPNRLYVAVLQLKKY